MWRGGGRESKEESFDNTWKWYEIEISVSLFIGSQPHAFICILSVAALELKWQTWAWPVKPKIFSLWPFTESFCQPLAESMVFFMLGMGWPSKTRFCWCGASKHPLNENTWLCWGCCLRAFSLASGSPLMWWLIWTTWPAECAAVQQLPGDRWQLSCTVWPDPRAGPGWGWGRASERAVCEKLASTRLWRLHLTFLFPSVLPAILSSGLFYFSLAYMGSASQLPKKRS